VEFTQPVEDHGYGLVTYFRVPGEFKVQLYEPKSSSRDASHRARGPNKWYQRTGRALRGAPLNHGVS
jgi:hypothetical protein